MRPFLLAPMLLGALLLATGASLAQNPIANNSVPLCTAIQPNPNTSCIDESTQVERMHACPTHFALTGASNSNNRFLCTWVGDIDKMYVANASSPENQVSMGGYASLACKAGFVTLGINIEENRMYCGAVVGATIEGESSFRQVRTQSSIVACPATVDTKSLSVMKGWNQSYSTMICQNIRLAPAPSKR